MYALFSSPLIASFNQRFPKNPANPLYVQLAQTEEDLLAAQRMRYRVFVEEAHAPRTHSERLDIDRFDPYCHHLLVRRSDNDEVVGNCRFFADREASKVGGYYADLLFDLKPMHQGSAKRIVELSRGGVAAAYRDGQTLMLLRKFTQYFLLMNECDYAIGSLDVPVPHAKAVYEILAPQYLAAEEWRVSPKTFVPEFADDSVISSSYPPAIPPLIKGFLNAGAKICGAPTWEEDMNVACLFVVLECGLLRKK